MDDILENFAAELGGFFMLVLKLCLVKLILVGWIGLEFFHRKVWNFLSICSP